ncbi:RagB/SusD family nutrient uptake outer membrane protein [Chitinophaga sancti]|uniref:RagB/SusD family nutrient uptake outer membrane protein n=1 Tax=Chitinophaga sancti TaxID=1004 RepID=A0A1K1SKI5_9BACT|nr:RagB/SusD family nutrient uptake outer membrane protein [Chitinophaga sancti]WQD64456.1 RagB/SusD family nutrient uptake outer membrane protein [Chitinophaga sancti]WQG89920.1 RagB/SusD family nutrient uptake outer membrane protein [Chitinophaga sancti]SFW84349.1 SusD family protein [Chitinophaga sancti]
MKRCIYSLLLCLALSGCDQYLDITPKGSTLLTTITDYDQWLNDPDLAEAVAAPYCDLNFLGDNVDIPNVPIPAIQVPHLVYLWAQQHSLVLNISPEFWGYHYATINKYNTVLAGIDQATGGTNGQKRSLKAEALLGRAYEYFYLVNEYGNEYDSATASKDLAVPYMTSNDVSQQVPGRSTVAEIYQHIIEDLTAALPDLPADNSTNRLRGSRAAAYSVLARAYFYARDYTNAGRYASLALANTKAVMMDFNGTLPVSSLISIQQDVIYGRLALGYIPATLDFMRSFEAGDLRVKILYLSSDGYKYITRGGTNYVPAFVTPTLQYTNTGTSVQEMKLIVAEAAARNNDLSTALQQLNDIRKNRFPASTYQPISFTTQADVFNAVLMERGHELPFAGLRWFDMRRLDKENRMGTVNRYDGQGNVIAELPPHSAHYTLQIPVQVLSFNPDMPQNPY